MNEQLIAAIAAELAPVLVGRTLGKVWQTARTALVCDLRPAAGHYLFISVEPQQPRLYLIHRPVRLLEQQALAPEPFTLALRKHIGGGRLAAVSKDAGERIVRFVFRAADAVGDERAWTLVAQLTGRAANLFLLDATDHIVAALRPPRGTGQDVGELYQPPPAPRTPAPHAASAAPPFAQGAHATLSAAADEYYSQRERARAFDARAAALLTRLRQETEQRIKLRRNLEHDLAAHGEAETHKRVGELLLANVATAERQGARVRLTDYFAAGTPIIELELAEHTTLPEEAARRFARYGKAKRAAQEINERRATLQRELAALATQRAELERIIAARDEAALTAWAARLAPRGRRGRQQQPPPPAVRAGQSRAKGTAQAHAAALSAGARRYRSSDGYEILVGRGARDNDQLTFRVARPHDLWLHAADYPGSHVIVRNPQRIELPHRTVVEAAQLAAHYSQAKLDAKVAVHYTQRKFVAKPKGAAPGLVRLSSFKTLLVAPRESGVRA